MCTPTTEMKTVAPGIFCFTATLNVGSPGCVAHKYPNDWNQKFQADGHTQHDGQSLYRYMISIRSEKQGFRTFSGQPKGSRDVVQDGHARPYAAVSYTILNKRALYRNSTNKSNYLSLTAHSLGLTAWNFSPGGERHAGHFLFSSHHLEADVALHTLRRISLRSSGIPTSDFHWACYTWSTNIISINEVNTRFGVM